MKENNNLSFSNSERQMFANKPKVKCSLSCCVRSSIMTDLASYSSGRDFKMDCMNKLINQTRLYWYIGSILARSFLSDLKFLGQILVTRFSHASTILIGSAVNNWTQSNIILPKRRRWRANSHFLKRSLTNDFTKK